MLPPMTSSPTVGRTHSSTAGRLTHKQPVCVRSAHTLDMKRGLGPRQRSILVGLGLIGVVLALTWVVLYLNAGATSAP